MVDLKKYIKFVKDILFPAYCLGCGVENEFVCEKCFQTLDCSGVFCCPVCHTNVEGGRYCSSCKPLYLDRHIAATPYKEDELIGKILHTFKYQYVEDIKLILEKMVREFFISNFVEIDTVVPVPLHRRRQVERGFNQSAVISKIIGDVLDKPVEDLLIRKRHTKQQAKLNRKERLKNLDQAFVLKNNVDIKNKRVLLVDDVFTTGSTLQECAKVLKSEGASEVVGFSVARG